MNTKLRSSGGTKILASATGLGLLGTFGIEWLAAGLMLGVAYAAYSRAPSCASATRPGRKPGINTNLAFLAAGALAVLAVVLVVLALPGPVQSSGLHRAGARDSSHYMGVEYCNKCHGPEGTGGDQYTGWRATAHGTDFTNRSFHGEGMNMYTQKDGSCQPCHVVGYNYTDRGGFDPSLAWNLGNNSRLLGVQCEDCHGPGSDLCEECHGPPIDHSHEATNMVENPTPEQSCNGYFAGTACHGPGGRDVYTSWSSSLHSPGDQRKAASPQGLNTYCAKCKSPSQYNPNANPSNATAISKEAWRGISCADCHSSHGNRYEGQLKAPANQLCNGCHNSDHAAAVPGTAPLHPQKEMFLGILGANVTGKKGMPGTTCVDCHGWKTPQVREGLNLSDITGYPYPQNERHVFKTTPEACADCHSDLLLGMPDDAMPANNDGANATLHATWTKWMPSWLDEVEKWNATVGDWQSETRALTALAGSDVAVSRAAIDSARANRTKDPATIAMATGLWGDAYWNYNLVVNDKSDGVHNHKFAMDLLRDAQTKARRVLGLMSANSVPLANAGPSRMADTNQELSFNASASLDMDGTKATYFWDFGDGTNSTDMVAIHGYADDGLYYVALTVTDNLGAKGSATINVFVNNVVPVAIAGNSQTVDIGTAVTLNASGSTDSDGTIVTYAWDFGDKTTWTGVETAHTYQKTGAYGVVLTVTDDDGAKGIDILVVTVLGPAPVPNAAPIAMAGNDQSTSPSSNVSFNASGSTDPDGTIVNYTWDFGDGTSGYDIEVTHAYAKTGVYAVILTVTDNLGGIGMDILIVSVVAPPTPVDLTPIENDISSLQNDISALTKDMAGLNISVNTSTVDTSGLKKDVSDYKRTVNALSFNLGLGLVAVLVIALVTAAVARSMAGKQTDALWRKLGELTSDGKKNAPKKKKLRKPAPKEMQSNK